MSGPLDVLRSAIEKGQALVLVGAGVSLEATKSQVVQVGKREVGSTGVPGGWYWVVRRKLLFSNDLWRKAGHSVYRTQVTEIK